MNLPTMTSIMCGEDRFVWLHVPDGVLETPVSVALLREMADDHNELVLARRVIEKLERDVAFWQEKASAPHA